MFVLQSVQACDGCESMIFRTRQNSAFAWLTTVPWRNNLLRWSELRVDRSHNPTVVCYVVYIIKLMIYWFQIRLQFEAEASECNLKIYCDVLLLRMIMLIQNVSPKVSSKGWKSNFAFACIFLTLLCWRWLLWQLLKSGLSHVLAPRKTDSRRSTFIP